MTDWRVIEQVCNLVERERYVPKAMLRDLCAILRAARAKPAGRPSKAAEHWAIYRRLWTRMDFGIPGRDDEECATYTHAIRYVAIEMGVSEERLKKIYTEQKKVEAEMYLHMVPDAEDLL